MKDGGYGGWLKPGARAPVGGDVVEDIRQTQIAGVAQRTRREARGLALDGYRCRQTSGSGEVARLLIGWELLWEETGIVGVDGLAGMAHGAHQQGAGIGGRGAQRVVERAELMLLHATKRKVGRDAERIGSFVTFDGEMHGRKNLQTKANLID